MNTRKFAFIASLLSVIGLLAGSAHAAVTIPSTINTMLDLEGETPSVKDKKDAFFGDGGGIKNGTLNVNFYKDVWWTMDGRTFTVGADGNLYVKPSSGTNKSCEMNFQGGATLIIDGGTVVNENNRGSSYGQYIGCDKTGKGEIRIVNGGTFTSKNLFVRIGFNGGATGILSIDDGTINVGSKKLLVACDGATGILAVTNATINSGDIELCETSSNVAQLRFVDSDLNIPRVWANKNPASGSFCIMDGCTVNSTYKEMLSNLNSIPYQLEGKGLIANPSVDSALYGTYVSRVTDRGPGPIVKKGPKTVTFKGMFDGPADLRAEEGTLAFSGATLPDAGEIDLTISGTGAFEGLDQSETYKSLTLGEDAVLPVVFADGAVTTFKAAEFIVTATADHPVVIAGTGTLTENTVVAEGLTVTDASLFVLSGVAGSLKIEDGKLIAVKPSRPVDMLIWAKGSTGDNWSGTDNWTYGDPAAATTFQEGDTAVFATAGDKTVVDADVTAARVEFKADATVTGEATLATTNITVDADVTATIAAPLGEDIEKTGEGELVLQDYADGKALDLKAGKVALAWSDAAKANPFSTEVDANVIAGVLDFGGAKQALAGSVQKDSGIFRNGGEVRNGEILVDPSDWLALIGVTDFTIGEGANVSFKKYTTNTDGTRNRGQLNLQNTYLRISGEGAWFAVMNERDTQTGSPYNSYGRIGSTDGDATVEISAGGMFSHEKRCLILGFETNQGAIIGNGGTVTFGSQDLYLSYDKGGAAFLSLTNSTLTARYVNLGWSGKTPGKQTIEFVGGTTVKVAGFKKNAVHAESYILFDDATLVPTAAGDLLPNLGVPTTIGANGLVVSNDYDVAVAAPLAGEGKLTKTGTGMLTFSGAQSFEGGLEVCAGSICSTLTADGFATQDLDLSLNLADGETVRLAIAGTPEPGENYTLFKSGITEDTLSRLTIDANYELSLEDGQLKVKLMPLSLTWTGDGNDKLWSTVANWRDALRRPAKFDTVIFDGESDETEYDLANGLLLKEIDVNSGAWTTKVDTACFAGVPVQVKSGALFALTGAKGKTNPFSTANAVNAIAGVLDLGGATQTFAGALADGNGIFRDGGEIRNVALTIDPAGWFRLHNVSFTIGQGANVSVKRYTDSKGQLNLYNSYLKIDGGSLTVLNERNVSNAGAYIGNDGDATIEILNGGKFSHPNKRVILGYGGDGKGAGSLVGDHATVDLEEQTLNLGNRNGSASRLVLTNSTLTCSAITLGFEGTPGKQTVELVNTTVKFNQFNQEKEPAAGSSITFDGATIVDNHGATALLQVLGIPYTIAEGGLTVKVANLDPTKEEDYVSFPGTFNGEGDFILVAAGKTPREARFSGEAEKGFTGNLVVSNGVTVVAGGKTFKGGLYACEGSTLNVATSVFDGNVTIEEGVKFAGLDAEQDYEKPVTLLQTKGTITSPLLEGKNPNTRNRYFIRSRLGVNVLCYGRKPGTIITIR